MAKTNYFIYPKDVTAFGFDWGKLSLTVAPEVNGARRFSGGVVDLPSGEGHSRHNHPGAEEIIFVISGEGEQMVEDENGNPITREGGPAAARSMFRKAAFIRRRILAHDRCSSSSSIRRRGRSLRFASCRTSACCRRAPEAGAHIFWEERPMNINPGETRSTVPPFDTAKLDGLMEEAGIDVIVATSKHNTQYLMGGYKFIFFAAMDAIGHSRYLPMVIYEKGAPDHSAYVGNRMEGAEHQNNPFWTPAVHTATWGTLDAAGLAVEHLKKIGKAGGRIGIEPAFLPSDARDLLASRLEGARFVDATHALERLRAVKTPDELAKLRTRLRTDHRLDAGDDRGGPRGLDEEARSSSNCGARKRTAACISNTAC